MPRSFKSFAIRDIPSPSRWALFFDGLSVFAGGVHAQDGKASQVDRAGQQLEVLGHTHQPAHAGPSAAVAAAQQMGEFSFDLWAGGAVVGPPGGIALAGAGGG